MFCVKASNMLKSAKQDNVASIATKPWVGVWSPMWDQLAQMM